MTTLNLSRIDSGEGYLNVILSSSFGKEMIASEHEFLEFLHSNGFAYERIEHPAVFTCAEAEQHRPQGPATSTKNLFLCDKKARRFFLVVTSCEKNVKLDFLAAQLEVKNLRFASEENLRRRDHDGAGK